MQPINPTFRSSFAIFPETTSPAHWRQLYAHHTTQISALQDLLYLLERGRANTSARDDKWANYCDTETLGILGELLRLWCIGSLPNINQRKPRRKVLAFSDEDDDGSDESDDFESDEDESGEAPNDEQLLSPLDKSKAKGQTLESLVVTIWKMLGETPKMQVKLASIAFHLFLIDVLPLAFQHHPKHAFFVMDLMRPYFTLENAYTKQFMVLFASLMSDTTQDFVKHYQERYPTLIAGPHSFSAESSGNGVEGSIDQFLPSGSVEDLLSLTSSGELDVIDLASSSEMTRYMLDTSLASSSDVAPRRPRNKKPLEATSKPALSKKQSERLVRQETRRKLKAAESKANDESLRERARLRLLITLWQNLKYFDPGYLPLLLRTKIADDLNTILTARFLPDSIVSLAVDAVKYIGVSQASTLEAKQVLKNMHIATEHVKEANLKLSILDALSRFVTAPGVTSLKLPTTAVLNIYVAEFERLAGNNGPTAALLANRYISYLNSAPSELQMLAKEYPPSVSALLGLLDSPSSLREAAILLLPKDPSSAFLLKTNIISIFKAYRKSSNQIPAITSLLLRFVRKILSSDFQSALAGPASPKAAQSSSSSLSAATDASNSLQEVLPITSIINLLESDFFEQCFDELEKTTSYDTNLHQMVVMLLEIKRPILDILVLRDGFIHRIHNAVYGSMAYYKPEYFKLHSEVAPTWLKLLVKTHKLGLWVLDETTPLGFTVEQELHPIVIDSIVKYGGISSESDGKIKPYAARIDRRIFEQFVASLSGLISRRPQDWQAIQSGYPKLWKHIGYLFDVIRDIFAEPMVKITEFLLAISNSNLKTHFIYHYLLDGLTQSLELTCHENMNHFMTHLECIAGLLIPNSVSIDPMAAAKATYTGNSTSVVTNTNFVLTSGISSQSSKVEVNLVDDNPELPDPLPLPNSPWGREYAELRESILLREPVMLNTDFEEAWQPKPKTSLPKSVYEFSSTLAAPEASESRFSRKAKRVAKPSIFDDDDDSNDLFGMNISSIRSKPADGNKEPANLAPREVLEDATVPPKRIARLSRVMMKFTDSFYGESFKHWQTGQATKLIQTLIFLSVKDVWFRERLFAQPKVWRSLESAKSGDKIAMMRLIVLYFRNETLQKAISDPQNVPHFAALLDHVLCELPQIVPPMVAYNIISVWLSNDTTRIAMKDYTKRLARRTLAIKFPSPAQHESFVNLWIGVLEPLVKHTTLYEGFELINCLLGKNSSPRIEKLSLRLYLNKIDDALIQTRIDETRVDYDTGIAFSAPSNGVFSSSLLRCWIKLWRPGNDMRPILEAFKPYIRAVSNLVPLLNEQEFETLLSDTYHKNQASVWNWIDFEKRALRDDPSPDDSPTLSAKTVAKSESSESVLSLASSAPNGPSPNVELLVAPVSSATSSSSQPTTTGKKVYSAAAKQAAIEEFVLCRFYQAELLATVLHARGRAFGEFYPLGEVKNAAGTWVEADPLLRLLAAAFSRFEKLVAPVLETMSSCKRYGSLIVAEVVKNRSFLSREHPIVILAVLQVGVLNEDLHHEYELYSCLPEMYEAVEIERLRSVAILRDMTRCASRHPEEFCKRVPTLPALIERALAYHDQHTTLETLALLNAISRQPMVTDNEVFRDLVLLECYQLLDSHHTQKKIKAHALALVFSLRHFGTTPSFHEPIDTPFFKSSSVSPSNKPSFKPSKPKKSGNYDKDDARLPLLLLDHHKEYSGSISSHEDDYVELSLMEEEPSPRNGKRTASRGSPATGSSIDSTHLGLLDSDDEWADIMKIVEKEEKAAKEGDNGDVWRFQFLETLTTYLTAPPSPFTPIAHTIVSSWVDASPALTLALPHARIREVFDTFSRNSHGLLLRILESPDHFEAESMFWENIASGQSPDGELNNGPLVGGALLLLALLTPELRRRAFFSSIEPESLLGSGSNLLSKIVSSISRWQPYHREAGLINLSAALLLLQPIARDLLSPSIMKSVVEQWNKQLGPQANLPFFKFVSSKLDGTYNPSNFRTDLEVKVKFFPESVADSQNKSSYDHQLGLALQVSDSSVFAAPHKRPILALIDTPLNATKLTDSGYARYALNVHLNPPTQSNPSIRIGFATKNAMKALSNGALLLGEVPGSYSLEQRSGLLLAGGATISTDRAPPAIRSELEMEINFSKQNIAFTLVDSTVKHYYYLWNIDTSETLYPVISFESPASVSLTERKTLVKTSVGSLSLHESEASPAALAELLRNTSADAAHARHLASIADPLHPLDQQETAQALRQRFSNDSQLPVTYKAGSNMDTHPPPPPPPPPAPPAPPAPVAPLNHPRANYMARRPARREAHEFPDEDEIRRNLIDQIDQDLERLRREINIIAEPLNLDLLIEEDPLDRLVEARTLPRRRFGFF